jgi:hypothetical protein
MSTTINISHELAAALELRRKRDGLPSLDAAAEAAIVAGLEDVDPHSDQLSVEELRVLIDAADASGAEIAWDAASARAEILRRYVERGRRA